MRYLPLTDTDRQAMLGVIGASSIDDLFVDVPAEARLTGPIAGLPMHASEMAVERHFAALARKNLAAGDHPFFLGAGAYKHHVPASGRSPDPARRISDRLHALSARNRAGHAADAV